MKNQSRTTILLTAILLAGAHTAAQAQQTIFSEDFEAGLSNWTTIGIWNLESDTDPCGSLAAPFPSGNQSAWFGSASSCSFWSQSSPNYLTSINPIDVPLDAGQVTLAFTSYEDVECPSCDWDWRFVHVSRDGGASWDFVGESVELGWHETQIDLSTYAGDSLLLRFEFDPVDHFGNDGLGWLIDDVRVEIGGCDIPSSYCTASINSTWAAASMSFTGSTSLLANDLRLLAYEAVPGQSGMFFYGPNQVSTPYGDGTLCVGPGTTGNFRLAPVVTTDGWGSASVQLDYTTGVMGAGSGQVMAGSTWNFSFWYRDPAAGNTGFNFSNALEVNFCR